MTRNATLLTVALIAALIAALAVAPAAVAADDDSNSDPLDEILNETAENDTVTDTDDSDDEGLIAGLYSAAADRVAGATQSILFIDGLIERTMASVNPFVEHPTNAESAAAFSEAVADEESTYIDLLNAETTPRESWDTHRFTFAHDESDPATVYLVANVTDDGTEDAAVADIAVLSEAAFAETERTVDEEWVVHGSLATETNDLTHTLAERYRANEDFDRLYQSRLAGQYCDVSNPITGDVVDTDSCDVRSTLWLDRDAVYDPVDDGDVPPEPADDSDNTED